MSKKRNPHVGGEVSQYIRAARAKSARVARAMDEEKAKLDLAAKLKAVRVGSKLSQTELAHRAGLKQPYIARLEAGRQYPSVRTLERIAQATRRRLDVRFVGQDR
jgi:DNA-binding XRE family transcriptional regulator